MYYLEKRQIEAILRFGKLFYNECFLQYFEGCLRVYSFHLKNLDNEVGIKQQYQCYSQSCKLGLRVFWKLYLKLFSKRLLRPNLNLATNLIPQVCKFEDGLIYFKMLFLTLERLGFFRVLFSGEGVVKLNYPLPFHISRRTTLISIQFFAIVKKSI